MGFQTPQYALSEYLKWTTSGRIQLPDFQRGYKWEDERVRQLLITILRGHPLGVVMLLQTGNDQVRFKPKPLEGTEASVTQEPEMLLLDGQQTLTSLTQALTGTGVVATMDSRGKLFDRRYYVDIDKALDGGEENLDDAVVSVPGDGVVRSNFGRDVALDLSTLELEQQHRFFPLRLLCDPFQATAWLAGLSDNDTMSRFMADILQPVNSYSIPAIELDKATSKAAVATVFEKVNTGGLPLNVFELLTAVFAGDKDYYDEYGTDFRLNDDWLETKAKFADYPALSAIENTDFLQAVTLLTTLKRKRGASSGRRAVSAKREDVLKLTLQDYLQWVEPLRDAFIWAADFLADRHIFDSRFLPYPKQLVPLAAIRVDMGHDADLIGPRERIVRWFWCGILGELYGGTIETRFVRDLEQVPAWAMDPDSSEMPNTINDATFVESRLHSLRTRNAAAYKGIYALLLGNQARDWMEDKALDMAQYTNLAVDIHHIFPQQWCRKNHIDDERRESIVNKTAIGARTNRVIGGVAPSRYMRFIEQKAQITAERLDALVEAHLVPAELLRADDFDAYFTKRRERLCQLVEHAMGKSVPRDVDRGEAQESSEQFDLELVAETIEEEY